MKTPLDDQELEYTEEGFWSKLANYAKQAGREVVEKALMLYYAANRPETPAWAKTTAFAALAYFILPTDAIPDITPLVGYSDDLGALSLAIATITAYINDDVKARAAEKLEQWFGK
jgi:uncharacterized membrane protein YkvA (DUF1232 family)